MTLIPCRNCGAEVSSTERFCPKCSIPHPTVYDPTLVFIRRTVTGTPEPVDVYVDGKLWRVRPGHLLTINIPPRGKIKISCTVNTETVRHDCEYMLEAMPERYYNFILEHDLEKGLTLKQVDYHVS